MVKKELFVCDQCGRPSTHLTQGSELPYSHGWRALEEFSFKTSQQFRHEIIRKHFCSDSCMFAFIAAFVKEQEEQIHQKKFEEQEETQNLYQKQHPSLKLPAMMTPRSL